MLDIQMCTFSSSYSWTIKCKVWSQNYKVWSIKCERWVRSVYCKVWTVKYELWTLKCLFLLSFIHYLTFYKKTMKCEVWIVTFEWRVTICLSVYLSVTHTHVFRKLWSVKSQGGTLIFSRIRRLSPLWGVQNSEFQYFFWVFRKMTIFGGMKILWIFFWGHHKIGLVWGSFLCILGSVIKVNVQNWDIFWVAKISNIFLGAWNSWYFLGVNGRCWVRAYVCVKISEYPPPPLGCKVSSLNCEEWSHHRFFVVFILNASIDSIFFS